MTLATSTPDGRPSARIVLLKGFDEEGFVFYTNYEGRKSGELEANPYCALDFYWGELERQVRVEGRAGRIPAEESDAYFAGRPRGSQLGAWASEQSRPIKDRGALEKRLRELEAEYEGREVPRPPLRGRHRGGAGNDGFRGGAKKPPARPPGLSPLGGWGMEAGPPAALAV